eukprot:2551322-Amphidinium_carterae.1
MASAERAMSFPMSGHGDLNRCGVNATWNGQPGYCSQLCGAGGAAAAAAGVMGPTQVPSHLAGVYKQQLSACLSRCGLSSDVHVFGQAGTPNPQPAAGTPNPQPAVVSCARSCQICGFHAHN